MDSIRTRTSSVRDTLEACSTYAASINWGAYQGRSAIALGGAVRLTENTYASGGGSFGVGDDAAAGGRAGVTMTW